jgi:hypothetical protein
LLDATGLVAALLMAAGLSAARLSAARRLTAAARLIAASAATTMSADHPAEQVGAIALAGQTQAQNHGSKNFPVH